MSLNRWISGPMARQLSARAMGESSQVCLENPRPGKREKERERGEELRVGGHEPGVDSPVQSTGAGTDADNYTRCVLDWVTLSGIVCVDVFVTE